MPWPWRDLLFLHGYVTDPRLACRLVTLPLEKPPLLSDTLMPARMRSRRTLAACRLCLGIGDGAVRHQ